MPLEVRPVEAKDFGRMTEHAFHKGGDLTAPLAPMVWPNSDDPAAMTARLRWSMKQQQEIFNDDPTVRFVKVIDTDRDNDIVSLARWHRYDAGFPYPDNVPLELNGAKPDAEATWPAGINVPLTKAVLDPIFEERPEWQGQRPMWILTTLITREADRQRGAGSMLVKWGLQKAIEEGVPAFIEATPAGEPLYTKVGFRRVGEHRNDLSRLGVQEPLVLARMAANVG